MSCSSLALSPRPAAQAPARSPSKRTVIAASTVLDGRGGTLRDTRVVIEGAKIVAIDPKAGPIDYDLSGRTVLPGWIDAHVHLTWIFGSDGRNLNGSETSMDAAYRYCRECMVELDGRLHDRAEPGIVG